MSSTITKLLTLCRILSGRQQKGHCRVTPRNLWPKKRGKRKVPSKRKAEEEVCALWPRGSRTIFKCTHWCLGSWSEETPRSAHRSRSVHIDWERLKHSSRSTSGHHDKGVLPPRIPRKSARQGEQGAVWKALDLVSSSPFSEEIECAELLKKFTTPRFEVYDGQTDPIAHISHYQ